MRCKNCGWENESGSTKCEKCNAPLSDPATAQYENRSFGSSENVNLKGTVSEDSFFGNRPASGGGNFHESGKCRKCGYPLAHGMTVCPMCGTPTGNNTNHDFNRGYDSGPSNQASPSRQGTVNPWAAPNSGASCSLKPLAWDNEGEHEAMRLSGDRIILNRANTDPANNTITSGEQAELTFENGAWYICDKSYQKTTYVHAGHKMKLEKGDIIILGNRRFEFNS